MRDQVEHLSVGELEFKDVCKTCLEPMMCAEAARSDLCRVCSFAVLL